MKKTKTYSQDFKENAVKEYEEVGSLSVVAGKNEIPITTLRSWVLKKTPKKPRRPDLKVSQKLEKENQELKVENELLRELLKKTNRAWLKD